MPLRAFDSAGVALGDRLNPLLVKEVRQALRGRGFAITFALTLLAAVTLVVVSLVDHTAGDPDVGMEIFGVAFGCLLVALVGYVPFSAYASMSREQDENTLDLLELSDMRPPRIVLGKLCAAAVEALLFVSAFGPFLVFTYLLPGVDIAVVVYAVGAALLGSFAASCAAIAAASSRRSRMQRAVGMFLVLALLAVIVPRLLMVLRVSRGLGGSLLSVPTLTGAMVFLTVVVAVFALSYAGACSRLAHAEENRSTAPRVVAAILFLILLAWATHAYLESPSVQGVTMPAMFVLAALAGINVVGFTEPDRLPRAVRGRVPKGALLAALAVPLLPGGGRAVLLFLLQGAFTFAWAWCLFAIAPPRSPVVGWSVESSPIGRAGIVLLFVFYMLAYVGLPAAVLSYTNPNASPELRRLARFGIVGFVVLLFFGLHLLGFITPIGMAGQFGTPFWLGDSYVRLFRPASLLALGFGSLAIALNVPRIVVGVREVLDASRARRARMGA